MIRKLAGALALALFSFCSFSNVNAQNINNYEFWGMDNLNTWRDQYVQQYSGTINSFAYNNMGVCFRDDANKVLAGPVEICQGIQQSNPWGDGDLTAYRLLRNDSYSNNGYSGSQGSVNLIDWSQWQGAVYGTDPNNCCSSISGSGAMIDNTSRTIMFSYGTDILSQTIAINQALKTAGVIVDGYNYGWTYRLIPKSSPTDAEHTDTLVFTVQVRDVSGALVDTYTYDRSAPVKLGQNDQWVTERGLEVFANPYTDPQSIALSIMGSDGGYWGGYYGPEVKDVSLNLIYRSNPCAIDPLFDASCPGYAEALAKQLYDQNCAANALYDSGCLGYTAAYEIQQCNINALYSPSCAGFQQAYYDQQCSFDALYDSGCTGYATAYFNQQCSLNSLYDAKCPDYATAYYNQQCTADALYDTGCTGYQQAYATKMLLEQQQEETTAAATPAAETATSVYVDPVASLTTVSATGDSIVDSVLAAPVALTAASSTLEVIAAPEIQEVASNDTTEETVSDAGSTMDESMESAGDTNDTEPGGDSGGDSTDETDGDAESGSSTDGSTDKKESTRDKVKRAMTERAQNLATEMAEAATVEAQVAVQAAVLATMGYLPGFGTYGGTIAGGVYQDVATYAPTTVPESRQGLRNGLAQQLLWDKLVETQYDR
jgi:hypothetical protein